MKSPLATSLGGRRILVYPEESEDQLVLISLSKAAPTELYDKNTKTGLVITKSILDKYSASAD